MLNTSEAPLLNLSNRLTSNHRFARISKTLATVDWGENQRKMSRAVPLSKSKGQRNLITLILSGEAAFAGLGVSGSA